MAKININLNVDPDIKYHIDKKLVKKGLSVEDYFLKLIENDLFAVVNFNHGYTFNLSSDKLLHKEDEIILANLEKKLFKYLLDNSGSIVSLDEINEMVWNGKDMSVFTLRNYINKIRSKTYHEIIINKSSRGYMMIAD